MTPETEAPDPRLTGRQSQRRRALITLGVVALLLFWAVWFAWSYIREDSERVAARTPAPTCRPYDPRVITPAKTTLNVFNATSKDGLAAAASKQLAARGFIIAEVANDPTDRKVAGVAEVRYGPQGVEQAKLILAAVKGSKAVKDARKEKVVDLVIGPKWVPLKPAAAPTGLPMCPPPT